MKNIKLSIIIPTYNVEKYISKTLDSILKQEYNNYEIIIIDDGSTDNTLNIIKTYKDKRIKLLSENNEGVSSARNKGIKEAKGDYLIFVDGDDYLEDFALKYIVDEINSSKKNTTFIGLFNTIFEKGCRRNCKCEELESIYIDNIKKEKVLDYLYTKRIIFTLWRFVVSRELIIKNNLYLVEGIIHEDEEWVPRLLTASKNFKLLSKPFYNYRIRKKSIMTTKRNDFYRQECLIKVAQELLNNAKNTKNNVNRKVFLRNAYKNLFQAYLQIREKASPIEPNLNEKNRIKKNIIIYGSSRSGKTTLANTIKNILRYSVISLDNIVSGFERGLPELNINHTNRDGQSVNNLRRFIDEYIKSLNRINQKTRMFYYIIEGSYFSIETLKKYKDDFVLIVLINNYKSPKEFYNNIKKNDTVSDWTSNLSDEELMNYCEILYKSEQDIKKICKELNIKYYVTGNNRIEVIDELIKDIKEMVKY